MINFDITNRFNGAVQFTAEIDCDESEMTSIKIGLAVRWGVKTNANLAGASLVGANLASAYLVGANLASAYLAGAYLAGASLAGASLAGASLAGAYLDGADLAGANLDGANLAGAHLVGANLAGADLVGANLAGASLAGAYLDGADLAGADLAGAYLARAKVIRKVAQIRRDDGYEFIAFALDDGRLFVRAGCRSMTTADFRAHVAKGYPDTPKAIETLAILDFIDARGVA